jgi:endogenous inhibitor of DNA gyrase (YacG/DUF329 family)
MLVQLTPFGEAEKQALLIAMRTYRQAVTDTVKFTEIPEHIHFAIDTNLKAVDALAEALTGDATYLLTSMATLDDFEDRENKPGTARVIEGVLTVTCPHCGFVNRFDGSDWMFAFLCHRCGKPVTLEPRGTDT